MFVAAISAPPGFRRAVTSRSRRPSWPAPITPAIFSKPMRGERGVEEARKFVWLDQLAVSPQWGFASTEEGNILPEEEQWAKLRLAVDVAKEGWGKKVICLR